MGGLLRGEGELTACWKQIQVNWNRQAKKIHPYGGFLLRTAAVQSDYYSAVLPLGLKECGNAPTKHKNVSNRKRRFCGVQPLGRFFEAWTGLASSAVPRPCPNTR